MSALGRKQALTCRRACGAAKSPHRIKIVQKCKLESVCSLVRTSSAGNEFLTFIVFSVEKRAKIFPGVMQFTIKIRSK